MADKITRESFPDYAWEFMKERFARLPEEAMFHLEGAGKALEERNDAQDNPAPKVIKARKLSKMIVSVIQDESIPGFPLGFSGLISELPKFQKRKDGHSYLSKEKQKDVPYFRKSGNLTMFKKVGEKFPD